MTDGHEEPAFAVDDPAQLLLAQLGYQRAALLAKLDGLTDIQLVTSRVPSGWTPLGLLNHLVNVERRWIRWGFEGEQLPDPWADDAPGGGWLTPTGDPRAAVGDLRDRFAAGAAHTGRVAAAHGLQARAELGGRFSDDPPTLGWILLHLVQEFGRHVGHLDIVRELLDGSVGE